MSVVFLYMCLYSLLVTFAVRRLLREQCLSALPEYTEKIREHLKIFDRMFAEFEYNYVCCMVHVKSVKEYELHQVTVLIIEISVHSGAANIGSDIGTILLM